MSLILKAPADWSGSTTNPNTGNSFTPDSNNFVAGVGDADASWLTSQRFVIYDNLKRNNFTASDDPTPANDGTQDYGYGSVWINANSDSNTPRVFTCLSGSTGAAVWHLGTPPPHNFRNLLDGGDFTTNPWQRNIPGLASANVIAAAISNTVSYFADRWFAVGGSSSSILMSKIADVGVTGFAASLKLQRSSGNTNTAAINFGQVLETLDSHRCRGQRLTLSFWAKAGANYSGGNLSVTVVAGGGTDQSASGLAAGTWTASGDVVAGNASLATSYQRYSYTGTMSAAMTQLGVLFSWTPSGTAGTDDSVYFMGLQLEIGGVATPFEHRDAQVELEIAQRYCWVVPEPASGVVVGTGVTSTANTQSYYMATPVQLRAAPTVTFNAGSWKAMVGAAAASGSSLAAGSTHTPNAISITGGNTQAAGGAAMLVGGGGTGSIIASADY